MAEVSDVKQPTPSELHQQLGEIEEKVSNLTGSLSDLEANKKRWLLIGICLHSIITPVLRKYVIQELDQLWQTLKKSDNIDTQRHPNQLKSHLSAFLNYEAINNNKVHGRILLHSYDYCVNDSVDLSKLFLQTKMTHYSGFDETCDLSALLGIIIGTCPSNGKVCAEKVRAEIRNLWAHCDFSMWDEVKYEGSITLIKDLVKSLCLPNQDDILAQVETWSQNGKEFIEGTTLAYVGIGELKKHTQSLVNSVKMLADTPEKIQKITEELTEVQKKLADLTERILQLEQDTKEINVSVYRLNKRFDEQEQSVPKHMREKYQVDMEEWRKDEETFIVTRATENVAKLIKENSVVLVTGSSGSGKSSIIHHVALELQTIEKYEVISFVTDPAYIIQYRDMKKNQVFVIDDFCGKNFINEQDLQSWKGQTDRIEKLLLSERTSEQGSEEVDKERNAGGMKILISCRLHIFKDEKIKTLKIFTKHSCDLQSEHYCLLPEEREKMIKKYTPLSDFEWQKLDKVLDKHPDFPLLCRMSKGKGVEELTELFSSPIDSIKNDIKDMIEFKPFEYCALVLCVLFHDGFQEAYMKPKTTLKHIEQKVNRIVSNWDINLEIEMKRKMLLDTFKRLDGTYVKKIGSTWTIAHDKLYEIIALSCGRHLVELFIEYAPSSFIAEQFRFSSIFPNQDQDESFLYLSEESENLYFDRLFKDIKEQDGKSLFYNQQLKETRYQDKVIGYINQNSDYCKDLFLDLDVKDEKRYVIDQYSSKPLIEACKIGFYDLVKYLISIGCNWNKRNAYNAPLYFSCRNGFVDIVKLLITNGVNNDNALYHACNFGHIDMVKMLLDRKFDPSQCDSRSGWTPLYVACLLGHTEIVKMLLDRNVDPSLGDSKYKRTPLYIACYRGHTEIVKMLLDRKADPSQCVSVYGETPLYTACQGGYTEIVEMLLDRNVDPSQCDRRSRETPLYVACRVGYTEIVEMLLDRNVDVTQRVWSYSGGVWETALDVARNDESIRNLIKSHMK